MSDLEQLKEKEVERNEEKENEGKEEKEEIEETEEKETEVENGEKEDEVRVFPLEEEEEDGEKEEKLSEEEIQKRTEEAQEMKGKGNKRFSEGDMVGALQWYESALERCPKTKTNERSIYFCNVSACYLKFESYEEAEESATSAIELSPEYVKAYLRRAAAREKLDKFEESLSDYKEVVERDPKVASAVEGAKRMEQASKEKQEREKEELMGKLKDLGNMMLKPFGFSTDDFQLQQDEKTGGYSVQMNQQQQKPQQ